MKRYLSNIAKNVRRRRAAQGLSQRQLAERARKSNRYISMLETGGVEDLRLGNLDDIAGALGCTILDLLGPLKSTAEPEVPARQKTFVIPENAVPGLDIAMKLLAQAKRQVKG